MNKKFYIGSTLILSIILASILFTKVPVISSSQQNVEGQTLYDFVFKGEISTGDKTTSKDVTVNLLEPSDGSIDTDGQVTFSFKVLDDQMIRSCNLYHDVGQDFGPDNKQINTFVQVDSEAYLTLENVPSGEYNWGIVCEDILFRKNVVDMREFVVEKSPPIVSQIDDLEIKEDGIIIIDLNQYFSDSNGGELKYEAIDYPDEINVNIDEMTGIATIETQKNWYGDAEIRFIATNELGLETESNSIDIEVTEEGDTAPRFVSTTARGLENGIDSDGYLFLECNATDDYQVSEISLYSDVSGTWKLEQTKQVNSRDASVYFILGNTSNGDYYWSCSAKDNVNQETTSQKIPINVKVDLLLQHTIPKFIVNNIDTDRSIFITFSSYLKDSLKLGKLTVKTPDGKIYYEKDMSKAQNGDFSPFGVPTTEYYTDVRIIPGELFKKNFAVGNKVQITIGLDYTYQGNQYRKEVVHEIEVVPKVRSEAYQND